MMRRWMVLTGALAVAACGADEPGRIPAADGPAAVTVSPAVRGAAVESFPAVVTSRRTAEIATRSAGQVREVLVEVGSRVRCGDEMVRLDDRDVVARVRAAEAALELAARSLGRMERLAADGAASDAELDAARAAHEAALARVREAQAQESYTTVRAPFDGVVMSRSVDPGDLAVPGRPLLSLVEPRALKVVAELPAARAREVRVGMPVTVRLAGADETAAATISRVSGALAPGARTLTVEAHLDDGTAGVLAGSYARLELTRPGPGGRWIPLDAVVRRGQLRGVWAVESGVIRLRWVRLGRVRGDAVELLAGPPGELHVVRRPGAGFTDGQPVGSVTMESFAAVGAGSGVAQ